MRSSKPGCSGSVRVNIEGFSPFAQGGRKSLDFLVMSAMVVAETYVTAGPARLSDRREAATRRSIARIGPHGRNLVILNFVRAHLVFVGQPAKTHLQNRIRAVVREATTSVGLFSKV
jgi:hypothetical protein